MRAPLNPIPGGHSTTDTHRLPAAGAPDHATDRLIERWRQRQDMVRARLRLELQGQAMCRRRCDGDKGKAVTLWAAIRKDDMHPDRALVEPLIAAMVPLADAQKWIERDITKIVRGLPLWGFAKDVKGLGEVTLGGIIGECAALPGEYRTVSGLWKRMGLAVIGGGRQRRVAGEAALEHGYAPDRRSLMWNIGNGLIKAQIRNPKGEDGKPIGQPTAIGPYGALYLERKAYEAARVETPIHAHNRAKRHIEKRLLRDLWQASRQAKQATQPSEQPPAGNSPSVNAVEVFGCNDALASS